MRNDHTDPTRLRLADELDDAALADEITASLGDDLVASLAGDDAATAPLLSFTPRTVPDDQIDSLWILAFGYRFADGADETTNDGVPPRELLLPGPVNEELGRQVAAFVADHPMPVVAQWEVADVLQALWVPDVIPVNPDIDGDGTVTYLSTEGVIEKGVRLAADAGVEVGTAGVLAHADHVVRCLMTAESAGMTAAVPAGVTLPRDYDTMSGQPWTRSRAAYLPVDLLARAHIG